MIFRSLSLAVFSLSSMASINIYTNEPIIAEGSREATLGAIRFEIYDDVFSTASPFTPIYLRVTLTDGAKLKDTLVDLIGTPTGHHPIYLAIFTSSIVDNLQLAASPEAVSIVRWRSGESSFWIRIQQATSVWIERNGELEAPSLGHGRAAFVVGIEGHVCQAFVQPIFQSGLSNLETNTSDITLPHTPVDTSIRVDFGPLGAIVDGTPNVEFVGFLGPMNVTFPRKANGIILPPQFPLTTSPNPIEAGHVEP